MAVAQLLGATLLNTYTLGLVGLIVAGALMGLFSSKKHFPVNGRTVLITGGSTGMGRALAKMLAQEGANVVIVARRKEKLDEAIQYIKSHAAHPTSQRFLSISADVTSAQENKRILDETTSWNNNTPPDIIWANAGAAAPGLFIDTSLESQRAQMDINYWSAAYLAHAALKLWLTPTTTAPSSTASQPPRHFIITSSSVAFVGVAGYSPYAPAKAALRSLADSLRMELNLYNGSRLHPSKPAPAAETHIHIVCPGTIISEGLERENATKHPLTKLLEEGDPKQTEDEVAAASIAGLKRGDYLITTQFLGHAMRVSSLGGSPRQGWGVVDTMFSWVTALVWLFVGPDMENKAWKWGKENGC